MDVSKQTQMQRLHPCSLGIILSLTSSNRPSRFFPEVAEPAFGSPLVSPIHSLTAFRAYSEMVASDTGETVLTSAAEEVLIAIYEQSFAGPGLIKSSVATLPISLKESIEAYEMVSHDLLPASHGKRSLDSEFEGFLHSFWKGGVLDAAEAIDQNFAKLSQAKVLVSSWISNKIGSLQNAFNTSLSGSAEEGGIPQFDDVLSELCQRQTDRAMDPLGQTLSRLVTSLSSPLGFYPSTITVNGQSSHTPAPSMNAYNMGSQTPYADPTVSPQALSAKRVRRTRKDKGEKRKRRNSEFDAQEVTHGPVLPDAKEAEEQEILKTAAEEVSRVELKSDVITDLMVKTANAVNSMLDERERTTTLNIERFAVAMSV
ncbi:hypothetical protein BC829DRAFT_488197 [Chytridium lagenaria]|nr:hypothetical protein BC829DRAFT_488197 [Chytridium lagenaria]